MSEPSSTTTAAEPFDVPAHKRPRHIAVIMDGNGRWAQRQGLPRIEGHSAGAAAVRRTTEEFARLGIEQITLYCLSSENWKRPRSELDFLMQLLQHYMIEERASIREHGLRVSMIGRREGIPADVLREVDKTIEFSRGNPGLRVLPGDQLWRPGRIGGRGPRDCPPGPLRRLGSRTGHRTDALGSSLHGRHVRPGSLDSHGQ